MKPSLLLRSNSTPQAPNNQTTSPKKSSRVGQVSPYNLIRFHSGSKHDTAGAEAEYNSNIWTRRGSVLDKNREEIGSQQALSRSNSSRKEPSVVQDNNGAPKRSGMEIERATQPALPGPQLSAKELAANRIAMELVTTSQISQEVPEGEVCLTEDKPARELSNSIQRLSTASEFQTNQLAATYDTLTEKIEELQAIVSQFSELQKSSLELNDRFDDNDEKFQIEIKSQIRHLGEYEEELRAVRTLQKRLDFQRTTVELYKGKLEIVQQKIGKQKQMDVVWRQRASRRLRLLWGFMAVLVIIWLLATSNQDTTSLGDGDLDDIEDPAEGSVAVGFDGGAVPIDVLSAEAEQVLRERHQRLLTLQDP
ncbi:hypothetical protein DFH27DRAFT_544677 [Peziza echinospora]|nr:hypothetical protein DFH27DRAFT_544677 [Peziza echinospora]